MPSSEFVLLAGSAGLKKRRIVTHDVFRPGLALAGYTKYFLTERVQIIGNTELSYLGTLPRDERRARPSSG